ncbi:MAG: invasion associated locus B family protein [Yoonia sp.]|nr:invasion associated locus B family protein [Yoonia sp.]
MLQNIKPFLLAGLIAAAAGVSAQETTTEETAAPVAEETAAPEAAADLDMGTEVAAADAVGTPYIRDTFGDWSLRCLRAEEGQDDPCQLYQLLNDDAGNSVAEISMFPLPDGGRAAAGATIVVPLETLLTEQLQISVDGSATRRYPFTFCNRAGCVSRVGFTQEEVNQFKRGSKATMRMVPAAAPEEEVVLDISLSGFTAGYDSSAN